MSWLNRSYLTDICQAECKYFFNQKLVQTEGDSVFPKKEC